MRCSALVTMVAAASLTNVTLHARPPASPEPALSPWYRSLVSPDTGIGCCSETDCRAVEAHWTKSHYEVLIQEHWWPVPAVTVLHGTENPTGQAVVCWSPQLGIMCFVPGPGI